MNSRLEDAVAAAREDGAGREAGGGEEPVVPATV